MSDQTYVLYGDRKPVYSVLFSCACVKQSKENYPTSWSAAEPSQSRGIPAFRIRENNFPSQVEIGLILALLSFKPNNYFKKT